MAQAAITINGRKYDIACEDGQEKRLLELGKMIDDRAKMLISSLGQINETLLLVMVSVLLADELKESGNKKEAKSEAPKQEETKQTSNIDENLDNLISEDIYKLLEQLKSVANTVKKL